MPQLAVAFFLVFVSSFIYKPAPVASHTSAARKIGARVVSLVL